MTMKSRAASLLFVLIASAIPLGAVAHPLGNFTINHLARVRVEGRTIRVEYALDIAEIPTFQITQKLPGSQAWTPANLDAWARSEAPRVTDALTIVVDGRRLPLHVERAAAHTRPGAGGLPTLYWSAQLAAPIAPGVHAIEVSDALYGDRRIGWKDIVVDDESEPTAALTHYPALSIASPRRVSSARFRVSGTGIVTDLVKSEDPSPDVNGSSSIARSNALSDMFSNPNRAPLFVFFTVLVAFGLGALHAIEPGHGKALLAFTLVGSRATVKQAMILAASLTFAHTIGVFVLGLVLFFVAGFATESIYPWITLISGAAIALIGARNLARSMHGRIGHRHEHAHGLTGDHHHGDGEHAHSHAVAGTGPIDFRAAIVAAMSGGVAPCPAAIVVMLAALRLHQLSYGLLLIVVFSLGLAAVLTALGIAVVHGAAWISRSRRLDAIVAAGPLLSAFVISVVGAVMVAQGLVGDGVRASVWLLGALAFAAIVGYAFSAQHTHTHPGVAQSS